MQGPRGSPFTLKKEEEEEEVTSQIQGIMLRESTQDSTIINQSQDLDAKSQNKTNTHRQHA